MSGTTGSRAALLISPAYFGYEKDIITELEKQGFTTMFVDERPTNSAIGRAVMRVGRRLVRRRITSYYRAWQANLTGHHFDIVLVIKAEITPRWFLEWLRSENPHARFVLYLWDSISINKNFLQVLDLFDRRLSFDREDVGRRTDLEYLPLFYTTDFSPLTADEASGRREYSMSFVGTLRPGRFALVKKVFANHPQTFTFLFVQARWYFAVVKYLTHEHPGIRWRDVAFSPMTRTALAEVFRNSHAVVDMPAPGQIGSTIRTFEVLSSGAVLITTNVAVIHERFYDPERIIILSQDFKPNDIDAIWSRLDSAPPPIGLPLGFDRYSLASWVHTVVSSSAPVKHRSSGISP